MRRFVWTIVAALAGGLWLAPAAARDIYVHNLAGDDRYTGTQPQPLSDGTGPVRTINKALRLANAGDRIMLTKTDQPYRECLTLCGSRHSGYAQQTFTIQGNGATLDGSAPVPADAWQFFRGNVFRFRPLRQAYQQLFLDSRPAVRVPADPTNGVVPKLATGQWCYTDGWIYFCVDKTKLPRDYPLSFAALPTGITLYHVHQVAIVDLTIQGFQTDGLSAFNSVSGLYLGELICRGNGRAGVTVGGASRVELDACLLGDNGSAQLLTLPYGDTQVRNCRLLGNSAPGWVDEGGRVRIGDQRRSGGAREIEPSSEKADAPAPADNGKAE